mgnify:CR=1 FL=1
MLFRSVGGPEIPGTGFALGMDRIILAMEEEGLIKTDMDLIDVYIVTAGEKTENIAVKLLDELRISGISCEKDYFNRKVKAQFKEADKLKAKFTIIIGEDELEKNKASIKNMRSETQETVDFVNIIPEIKKRLEDYDEKNTQKQ